MACMKHVGVNVAADPLMTVAYTGVNAGLVLMVADDPGMFSSQNEQDTRHYARMAKVPCIEPTDSGEARSFVRAAFELSEAFDTPVILRTTTRISHCKSVVESAEPVAVKDRDLAMDVPEVRHAAGERQEAPPRRRGAPGEAPRMGRNNAAERGRSRAARTSGSSRTASPTSTCARPFPDALVLKLGMTYPLPEKKIRDLRRRR